MGKVLVVYTSQNGSTGIVAETIGKTLREEGHRVDVVKLRPSLRIDLAGYDFIGFGCPVYMFRPSYEMTDFLGTRNGLKGKRAFTFVTFGSEIGDGANFLRDRLRGMGVQDLGHISCSGKHRFPGYVKRGFLFSPEGPTETELKAAASFSRRISEKISSNSIGEPDPSDRGTHWISRFERFVTNRFFIRNVYSRFFAYNEKLCASCGNCVSACPVGNIQRDPDGRLHWNRDCVFCLKCEISCPKKAISSPISWPLFAPFLAYNVKRTIAKNVPYRKIGK